MAGRVPLASRTVLADEGLVAQARRGDAAAFDQLYRLHRDAIYTFCLTLCADREEAQDLLQETFVKAYRALSQFRGDAQFLTWLHRITVNLFHDSLRARRRLPEPPPPAPAGEPDAGEEVRATLARLRPKHRLVLALRYARALSYQEIAEVLGWSLGRVKVTMHRAKCEFKDAYQMENRDAMS